MKTPYTYRQTQDAFVDYIKSYYEQYRYMFKCADEKTLLKVIAEMFSKFSGGSASKYNLNLFQRNIESEINKGYDLLESIKVMRHK